MTVRRGIIGLLLLTGLVYAHALGGAFIWGDDDYFYIDLPAKMKEPVKFAFTHGSLSLYPEKGEVLPYYRPLAVLSYYSLVRLFGLQPFAFHFASLAVHAAAGVLVFLLVLEFAEIYVAWLAAALFVVHPLHVEPVAWMTAFTEVLAGMLVLLSLYGLVRSQRGGKWLLAVSYLAAALAFFTKETALALPLMAALFVGWRAWPFFALAGGTLLTRALAIGWALSPRPARPLGTFLRLAATAALHYAKVLVWPWPLAPEYDMLHPPAIAWVIFFAALTLAAWLAYRSRQARLALMLMALPLLSPLAAVLVMPARFLAPDRNAYLAVLGLALLVAYAARFHRAVAMAALALMALYSALSVAAIRHWRDPETLWAYTLRVTPNSKGALMNLGFAYFVTKRFADADRLFEHGLALRPNDPDYLAARAMLRKLLESPPK